MPPSRRPSRWSSAPPFAVAPGAADRGDRPAGRPQARPNGRASRSGAWIGSEDPREVERLVHAVVERPGDELRAPGDGPARDIDGVAVLEPVVEQVAAPAVHQLGVDRPLLVARARVAPVLLQAGAGG